MTKDEEVQILKRERDQYKDLYESSISFAEGYKGDRDILQEKLTKAIHSMNMAIFQFEMGRNMQYPVDSFKRFIEENKL